MDDDIDIEEHDILEHPQIKNLFSEYSEVKIEYHPLDVSDAISEDQDIQFIEQEPESAEDPAGIEDQEVILPDYPYQYGFEETQNTATDSIEISDDTPDDQIPEYYESQEIQEESDIDLRFDDSAPFRQDRDTLPPEDIYHYNNKIILGTKPSHHQKTQNSAKFHAEIVLEDWKNKLENSQTFCKECGILFSTVNTLDDHKMTWHSLLIAVTKNVARKSTSKVNIERTIVKNQARKSTVNKSSKYCYHCKKEFPDSTALIRHLYELLPLKQFQCDTCDAVFNTQKDLILHNKVHVKVEITKRKVTNESRKRLVFEEDVKKKSLKMEYCFLPKSVVYQCSKCNVHFLTCIGAWQHLKRYCKGEKTKKLVKPCKICKLRFRCFELVTHRKQHKWSNKIKIYKITRNIINRTLICCPTCNVYFDDSSMKKHIEHCGNIPTTYCSQCKVNMPDTMYSAHQNKHIEEGLKRSDFKFIETFLHIRTLKPKAKTFRGIKRKLEEHVDEKRLPKIIKLEPTVKTSKKYKLKEEISVQKQKLNTEKIKIFYCQYCQVCLRRQRAENIHVNKQCLKEPQHLLVCHKCGIQLSKKGMKSHLEIHRLRKFTIHNITFVDMKSNPVCPAIPLYPECEQCKIKFNNEKHLKNHVCGENYQTCKLCTEKFDVSSYKLHLEYHKMIRNLSSSAPTQIIVPIEPSFDSPRPALLKTYKNIKSSHILYKCKPCGIVTDQYDSAVEHSQNHSTVSNKKTIKCYICNLKFNDTCWSSHSNLHSKRTLNNSDFKILTYDPEALLTEEWFELFKSLKSSQMSQIIKRSLYSIERSVPMRLYKDGCIEYTLYSCSKCQVCFQNSEITEHVALSNCRKTNNVCPHCSLKFQDEKGLEYHQLLHQEGVKFEDFRIINFDKSSKKYTLYKCRDCSACLSIKWSMKRHVCLKKSRYGKCLKCNQIFFFNNIHSHQNIHLTNPDFDKHTTKIVYFNSTRPRLKLPKLETKTAKVAIKAKRKVKKVKDKELRTQSLIYLNNKKQIKETQVNVPKPAKEHKNTKSARTAKVYKCACGLHFTTLLSIEKHFKSCSTDSDIHAENCSKCDLLFPTDVLVDHLCKHHSINTRITIEEFSDVQSSTECISKNVGNDDEKYEYDHKVFKCSECNVCYVNSTTCLKHVLYNHVVGQNPKIVVPCHMCGLRFSPKSLGLHVDQHHKNGSSLNRVLIEEYHPSVKKDGQLKIDRYMAIDRIQSLEVSSSMEEQDIPNAEV